MKRILYIDPLSSDGHINFNKIYLTELLKREINVNLVFRKDYITKLSIPEDHLILNIPNYFYKGKGKLINRINYLRILLYIKKEIDFSNYDIVVFSSYEEISLFFASIKHKLFLINHNNIKGLENIFKRTFFKLISRKNTHIVFEKYIKDYLKKLKIDKVHVLSHGLPESFKIVGNDINKLIGSVLKIDEINNFNKIIFSPSGSSIDKEFIAGLIDNSQFLKFLNTHKILLILKGNFTSNNQNIKVINHYLSKPEYEALILKSDAIIISYPNSHKYRVSAVLFECFANNKICFLSDIVSLRNYEMHFNYIPYFKDIDELVYRLEHWINLSEEIKLAPFKNSIKKLNPNMDSLFN